MCDSCRQETLKDQNLSGSSSRAATVQFGVFQAESSSCVVDLMFVLCGGAGVGGGRFPADGCGDAAVVLVVVGQRQVEQAGAGGQVDVLHVLHIAAAHGTQLREERGGGLASQCITGTSKP